MRPLLAWSISQDIAFDSFWKPKLNVYIESFPEFWQIQAPFPFSICIRVQGVGILLYF